MDLAFATVQVTRTGSESLRIETNSPWDTFTSFRFETIASISGWYACLGPGAHRSPYRCARRTRIKLCSMPRMRTALSDGTIIIRAYEPGIELAVFEAVSESVREVGPWMRTWREGATYAIAARHVAESIQAWHTGGWYDFAITRMDSAAFLGRIGLDRISASGTANVGYWVRTGQT